MFLALGAGLLTQPSGAGDAILRRVAGIPLPGVVGRIDHLALDPAHHRLFVAAVAEGSVEVLDLAENRRVGRIEGLSEPQGVLYLPEPQRLYVTIGGAAGVAVRSGADLASTERIATREDPDNIRYEAGADRIWVGAGRGEQAALVALGSSAGEPLFDIALDGHPESFQLETKGSRIFVNVPSEQEVEVVDRELRNVVTRWKLPCASNFPMAFDEERKRLFVVCRRPARIVGLDTDTGRVVTEGDGPADADDIFVDSAAGRIYVSAGEGLVRTYDRREGDRLAVAGDVPTGSGARTSLFDTRSRRLYVAVPARDSAPAEIQVFDVAD